MEELAAAVSAVSEMNANAYAAWWGACIATIVLIWDLVKWSKAGARVRVRTQCDVHYPDSKILETKQTAHVQVQTLAHYCHLEVTNTGARATTLIWIEATHSQKKMESRMAFGIPKFEVLNDGKAIPVVLNPGEVWSARIDMESISRLAERGRPVILIRTSYRNKPIRAFPFGMELLGSVQWAMRLRGRLQRQRK